MERRYLAKLVDFLEMLSSLATLLMMRDLQANSLLCTITPGCSVYP